MNEPIPFPHNRVTGSLQNDGATEIFTDDSAPSGRVTRLLDDMPVLPRADGLLNLLAAPLEMLPPETQAHLRTAGREASLVASSLAGPLLKNVAVTLNAVAEALNVYSERHRSPAAPAQPRRVVDIEVE